MVQDRYLLDILNAHQQEQELRKKRRIPKESVVLQMLLDSTLQERNMDKVYLDCLPVVPPEQVVARMLPLFNALAAELIEKCPGFTYFRKGIFLERSRGLLLDTDINISDLVQLLGFSNRTHFYRLFREAYGEIPLEFRKNHKGRSPSD